MFSESGPHRIQPVSLAGVNSVIRTTLLHLSRGNNTDKQTALDALIQLDMTPQSPLRNELFQNRSELTRLLCHLYCHSAHEPIRTNAINALSQLTLAMPEIQETLKLILEIEPNHLIRADMAQTMGELGRIAVTSSEPNNTWTNMGQPLMIALKNDINKRVQYNALYALINMHYMMSAQLIPELTEAFIQFALSAPTIRLNNARTEGGLGALLKRIVIQLCQLIIDPLIPIEHQSTAIESLATLTRALPDVTLILQAIVTRHTDKMIRFGAISAIIKLRLTACIDSIILVLRYDVSTRMKFYACDALILFDHCTTETSPIMVEFLSNMLKSKNELSDHIKVLELLTSVAQNVPAFHEPISTSINKLALTKIGPSLREHIEKAQQQLKIIEQRQPTNTHQVPAEFRA